MLLFSRRYETYPVPPPAHYSLTSDKKTRTASRSNDTWTRVVDFSGIPPKVGKLFFGKHQMVFEVAVFGGRRTFQYCDLQMGSIESGSNGLINRIKIYSADKGKCVLDINAMAIGDQHRREMTTLLICCLVIISPILIARVLGACGEPRADSNPLMRLLQSNISATKLLP